MLRLAIRKIVFLQLANPASFFYFSFYQQQFYSNIGDFSRIRTQIV